MCCGSPVKLRKKRCPGGNFYLTYPEFSLSFNPRRDIRKQIRFLALLPAIDCFRAFANHRLSAKERLFDAGAKIMIDRHAALPPQQRTLLQPLSFKRDSARTSSTVRISWRKRYISQGSPLCSSVTAYPKKPRTRKRTKLKGPPPALHRRQAL